MKSIQYMEVKLYSLSALNDMGADGWKHGTLVFEKEQYCQGGWSGILWREVNSDDADEK